MGGGGHGPPPPGLRSVTKAEMKRPCRGRQPSPGKSDPGQALGRVRWIARRSTAVDGHAALLRGAAGVWGKPGFESRVAGRPPRDQSAGPGTSDRGIGVGGGVPIGAPRRAVTGDRVLLPIGVRAGLRVVIGAVSSDPPVELFPPRGCPVLCRPRGRVPPHRLSQGCVSCAWTVGTDPETLQRGPCV